MKKDVLLPLRKLHGYMYERKENQKKAFLKWQELTFPFGKKVYVIGTPEHTNVGDSAITIAQIEFLKKCGYKKEKIKEITYVEYKLKPEFFKKYIPKKSTICLLGGGNMGDQWIEEEYFRRMVIEDFAESSVIIFPQTIFYSDTEFGRREIEKSLKYYNQNDRLTMVAREKESYKIMKKLYPYTEILLMPDIVLSTTNELYEVEEGVRTDVLLCLRNDPEKLLSDKEVVVIKKILKEAFKKVKTIDMYSSIPITKQNRRDCVRAKMQEFINAKLVVTDRLHGMIFAAITGTPCIVFSNYNQKVSGTYDWIKSLPYVRYVNSVDEMIGEVEAVLKIDKTFCDNSKWIDKFTLLEKVVKRYI